MNVREIFIVIWVSLTSLAFAGNDQSADYLFEKGNAAYQNENYSEAIDQYQSVLALGLESGSLYYNLGNAYYRTGAIGLAILNYECALKWLPNDENVRFNLKLANLTVKDRIDPPPEFFLFCWVRQATNLLSSRGWGLLVAIFLFIASVAVAVLTLAEAKRFRTSLKYLTGISAAIVLISVAAMIPRHRIETGQNAGIIIHYSVRSLAAPQEGSTELFIVHEGTKVAILDKDGDWLKIELIDGKQGWIPADDIGTI